MKLNEYQVQVLVCDYLDILMAQGKVVNYTAVNPRPNMEHVGQRMKAKKAGLRSGFPDLIILTKTKAICIELKVHPNKPSREQIEWGHALVAAGLEHYTCYGYEAAKEAIDSEL